jgi:excisionase family DNA binding protein
MAKRTEIRIETRRRLVIRRSSVCQKSWCERCSAEVQMITPTEAAALMNVSSRSIYQWIEEGTVHFIEGIGVMLVCVESLPLDTSEVIDRILRRSRPQ